MSEIMEGIKQAAADVYAAMNPTEAMFGTVVSTSPLQINIEQRMVLGAAQLILTRNVTDYTVEMTMNHSTGSASGMISHSHEMTGTVSEYAGETEPGGEEEHTHGYEHGHTLEGNLSTWSTDLSHSHTYSGRKTFTIHNGLAAGEKVMLLRVQEGQKFIVWDRVG